MKAKPFRGCRFEVHAQSPGEFQARLWSRHHSYTEAVKSYRSLVKNGIARGEASPGTRVELWDLPPDGVMRVLEAGLT